RFRSGHVSRHPAPALRSYRWKVHFLRDDILGQRVERGASAKCGYRPGAARSRLAKDPSEARVCAASPDLRGARSLEPPAQPDGELVRGVDLGSQRCTQRRMALELGADAERTREVVAQPQAIAP